MPRKVVSILISAEYPAAPLERTLRSIERQTFPSLEVIVCVSGDGYHNALTALSARTVPLSVIVPKDSVQGPWVPGLAKASGEFVCCLLAGDELAPTYLEKCLFRLEIDGADASAAEEEPPDRVPHICIARKRLLTGIGKADPSGRTVRERPLLASVVASSGKVTEFVPEVLAFPYDPPVCALVPMPLPIDPFAHTRRFSYASLVTGWPEPRQTILVALPFLTVSGSDIILSQLCRQLKRLGFRILLFTTHPAREDQGDTTNWFEDCCAGIYHLPRFLDIEHWLAFIAYLIQQHGVSVLWQVGSTYTYDLLPGLRELFPQLGVVDLLFNTSGHTVNHLKYNYLIDYAVTEHSGVKEWLAKRGVPEEHIAVIPNGVDLELYKPQPKIDWRTLQPRTAGDRRFVVAFLGRLSEEKAPDIFLQIAALMADDADIEFILCGAGPMNASLRKEAAGAGFRGRVEFLGLVPARQYLPGCDVVVVCSRLDGRPNIVLESLAMGIPVIASRVGGIPDMLPPGDEDLLCEPADPAAFAAAIRVLARDPQRYRRSAESARPHVEKHVPLSEGARAYAQIFENLARNRKFLDRQLTPQRAAASLGYEQDPGAARSGASSRPSWRAGLPRRWRGYLGNAVLLWKLRGSAQEKKLREQFDPEFYARQFPSGTKWRPSPLFHYLFFGFREGRNPSPRFDTRFYLTAYPDVRHGGWNPLLHFVMWGEQEGRSATPRPVSRRAVQLPDTSRTGEV